MIDSKEDTIPNVCLCGTGCLAGFALECVSRLEVDFQVVCRIWEVFFFF